MEFKTARCLKILKAKDSKVVAAVSNRYPCLNAYFPGLSSIYSI